MELPTVISKRTIQLRAIKKVVLQSFFSSCGEQIDRNQFLPGGKNKLRVLSL
jgi:hypothetical protein